MDLFPRANTLSLEGYKKVKSVRNLANCSSSMSSLVPWSLLTTISINHGNAVTSSMLESILHMAYNAHTLDLFDDRGILLRSILNYHHLTNLINQQVRIFFHFKKIC